MLLGILYVISLRISLLNAGPELKIARQRSAAALSAIWISRISLRPE
jgi:hypothetical protein